MRKFLVAAVLFLASAVGLATGVQAGETFLLLEDKDDLPPPYKQWWYATPSDHSVYDETHEVFIRGDGKHGDFLVSCRLIVSMQKTPSGLRRADG